MWAWGLATGWWVGSPVAEVGLTARHRYTDVAPVNSLRNMLLSNRVSSFTTEEASYTLSTREKHISNIVSFVI